MKTNNLVKNRPETARDTSSQKDIQMVNNYFERCSIFVSLEK